MLGLFFSCFHCAEPVTDAGHFPLCDLCAGSLRPCPPLCPCCASPACPAATGREPCARPWVASPALDSFGAVYLLVGRGYPVLRRWKGRGGPWIDRQVLQPAGLSSLPPGCDGIVAVPQRLSRSWRLGRSPAGRLASWIAAHSGLPVLFPLRPAPGFRRQQAELQLRERLSNRLRFEPSERLEGRRLLLVDDFMTTGHTLRQTALALREAGAREVHAFCLGLRPLAVAGGAGGEDEKNELPPSAV